MKVYKALQIHSTMTDNNYFIISDCATLLRNYKKDFIESSKTGDYEGFWDMVSDDGEIYFDDCNDAVMISDLNDLRHYVITNYETCTSYVVSDVIRIDERF